MTRLACLSFVLAAAAMGLISVAASAQSRDTLREAPATDSAVGAAPQPDSSAAPGAVIVVVDSTRHVAKIDVSSLRVAMVGRSTQALTDIAFNPVNHKLYGISYNALYELPLATLKARFIAHLGTNDANALVFDSSGFAYFAGYQSNRLYKMNVNTGRVAVIGSTGQYYSAGDLTFHNDRLVMSAVYRTTNPTNTTNNYLVTLNPRNAAIIGQPALMSIRQIYGLASTGKNELYGLAGVGTTNKPALYQLFPAASTAPKRDTLLRNLSGTGLSLIVGTAYNGNFQP
jgi:hypothetical protein